MPELRDSDIERELARRATGEWRAERVLSAVRGRLVRPPTESVPRWAAIVGIAAAIGLLAVLAVALPALAPGPVASPGATDVGESPEPQSMSCGSIYQLTDETGLVASCTSSEREAVASGEVIVSGADGTSLTVVAEWLGSSCADSVTLHLARGADSYSLIVTEAGGPPGCEGVAVGRAVGLDLREPIASPLVASRESQLTPLTPPPSPPPTAGIIERVAISCDVAPAANSERRALNVTVHDATGQVLACEAFNGSSEPWGEWRDRPAVGNHSGDPLQLEVTFTTSLCDTNADITLWLDRGRPKMLIYLPDEFDACRLLLITHRVVFQLSEPMSADDATVTVRSANDPPDVPTPDLPDQAIEATATARAGDGGTFTLTLRADMAEYAADEPIDVDGALSYSGTEPSIAITGQWLAFGFEQLDGDLEVSPVWTQMCVPATELSADMPFRSPYRKSGGYSPDDENAEFYRRYFDERELRLPPGTYRIYALSQFSIGDCFGERISMEASIVITVR